jgi:hypothetical protein
MNPFVLLMVGVIVAGFGAAVLLTGYMAAKQSPYPSTNLQIAIGAVLLGAGFDMPILRGPAGYDELIIAGEVTRQSYTHQIGDTVFWATVSTGGEFTFMVGPKGTRRERCS